MTLDFQLILFYFILRNSQ